MESIVISFQNYLNVIHKKKIKSAVKSNISTHSINLICKFSYIELCVNVIHDVKNRKTITLLPTSSEISETIRPKSNNARLVLIPYHTP